MKVTEIFNSIQGETSYAGFPCTFVRLSGCNLRCTYCDTRYAYYRGNHMNVPEVIRQVDQAGCPLVCITGGEPLLQQEVYPLAGTLLEKGYRVLVETNGSMPVKLLPEDVVRIVDVKCPGSGMSERVDWNNLGCLYSHDEVKFVVSSRDDYEWAKSVVKHFDLCDRVTVLVSAAWNRVRLSEIGKWILDDRLNVRLQPQLHKLIAAGEHGAPLSRQGRAPVFK